MKTTEYTTEKTIISDEHHTDSNGYMKQDVNEYISALLSSEQMKPEVVHHRELEARAAVFAGEGRKWHPFVDDLLKKMGIQKLYSHQAEAINLVLDSRHIVTATPTASGKTLVYNVPFFHRVFTRLSSMEKDFAGNGPGGLYIFPLKALAQDQMKTFRQMAAASAEIISRVSPEKTVSGLIPTADIYDGDTSGYRRKIIRDMPPNIIFTNPEMLHLSILPFSENWKTFLKTLEFVVIDEVHTYRGVMGSHMAWVFRRLIRLFDRMDIHPTFIFSSATIANPSELACDLTGLNVIPVKKSGAPSGKKHMVFLNPPMNPFTTAIKLLKAALHRKLKTIVYANSRKMTELMALWAGSGPYSRYISAYRAGLLPEERRDVEKRLSDGDLLAVITTSALELGIDIGNLDLCILVGYPGSVMAALQRGGRVGRSGQESAVILVAGEDALDQYFMRNPREFFKMAPEAAVINHLNPSIMERHLLCAASELPLRLNEAVLMTDEAKNSLDVLTGAGLLVFSRVADGYVPTVSYPQKKVDLRGEGKRYAIIDAETGTFKGEIDAIRAFRDTHPGAVYLHMGKKYLVESIDNEKMNILITPARVNYYTRVMGESKTEILEVLHEKEFLGTRLYQGRLKVTDIVTGYEKWLLTGKKRLGIVDLNLPPQVFETHGVWITIPDDTVKRLTDKYYDLLGSIHAMEHALISIMPLLVMTDRNDIGGLSTNFHQQTGGTVIFVYDGIPGGAGLTHQAYYAAEKWVTLTRNAIESCPCNSGCPACVHSPKCGSGNRPMDKHGAEFILDSLMASKAGPHKSISVRRKKKITATAEAYGGENQRD